MKTFDEISAYTSKNIFAWTNTLVRAAGFPIDKWSVFGSLSAAQDYVREVTDIPGMGDATALPYEGQLIAVANDNIQEVYVLDRTAPDGLRKLASGGDADDIARQLRELSSQLLSTDGIIDQLSDAIDTNNVAAALSVENLSVDAYTNLSIALTSEAGTGTTLKTYTLTQGGQEIGKIDIPKDMVIEAAGLVVYDGTSDKITINGKEYNVKYDPAKGKPVAGEYIVMITAVTEDQIWIPVADLIHDSEGGSTTTISVGVAFDAEKNKNVIKAVVLPGSISESLLSSDLTTKLANLRTDINTVSTDLGEEVERASASEEVLSGMISDEETRATQAEAGLQTLIEDEATTARAAEETLTTDLAAEVERATGKETELETAITAEETRATQAEAGLQTAIDNEASRAKGEESTLSGLITAEETRATEAEAGLQSALTAETNRAKGEEAILAGLISTEETERKAADSTLQTNINNLSTELTTAINSEASTREAQDAALDAKIIANTEAIAAETERAEAKETALSTKIDAEIARAKAAEEANAAAIEAEEARALTAEAELQAAITAEETRATEAETELQANIDALSTYADQTFETIVDAEASHKELSDAIDAEAAARDAADKVLEAAAALSVTNLSTEVDSWLKDSDKGYVNQDVTTDNKIATIKDVVGLSGVIHFRGVDDTFISGDATTIPDTEWYAKGNKPVEGDIIINTDTAKEFLFTGVYSATDPTVGKWRELGDEGLYATKQELEAEIARAEAAEQELSDLIAAEEAARIAKDNALSGEISSEVDRATAAEDVLNSKIDAETTRAEGIESELSTKVEHKVWIKDAASTTYADGAYASELSVIKVTEDEYMQKVADGTLLKDGVLYVISSDHINAYGQRIINVADPISAGDATNKQYVDTEIKKVADSALSAIELNGLSFDIANNKATLNISAINCGTATQIM